MATERASVFRRTARGRAPARVVRSKAGPFPRRGIAAVALLTALLASLVIAGCTGRSGAATRADLAPRQGTSARGLHFVVSGHGTPLVLIHGFQTDHREWDEVAALLERDFRVIRYDLRGHGRSGRAEQPFFPHEELAALLDELRIPRAAVVGLSAGATVALDLATIAPERVSHLVLVSPGLPEIRVTASREWMRPIGEALRAGNATRASELWWEGPIMAGTRARGDTVALRYRAMILANAPIWTQNAAASQRPRPFAGERLAELRTPMLVVTGDRDETGAQAQADSIRARVPAARHHVVRGAGHMISTERPAELAGLVRAFLAARRAGGRVE